ncbi:hypothetical protein L1267_18970 [Pseudoalteromonas sp. OFAV1]|uniref:hypothetical protein n=1 Tax=Pseudoalteromonas sp. OFAV1 TaxID=2908892 RepID=UPI001F210A52|nr:hypothetical protein [Pseudoalteromonas sp. OFAV1]MCF2902456.1 hypothetical protein [Pseudoalteromonas sp. OFAV1]
MAGIEDAYNNLCQRFDTIDLDDLRPGNDNAEITTVSRNRNVHALVDESADYLINKQLWEETLRESGNDEDLALSMLIDKDSVCRINYENSLEVTTVHDSNVMY